MKTAGNATIDTKQYKILIDLSEIDLSGKSGGIRNALWNALHWLGKQSEYPLIFVVIVPPSKTDYFFPFIRPNDIIIEKSEIGSDIAARLECDVVYCPLSSTDAACPGIPTVSTFVDLLHRDYPHSLTSDDISNRENLTTKILERSDRIQVISNYTKSRFEFWYSFEGQVFRTYLPCNQFKSLTEKSQDPEFLPSGPYFLYPANGWKHKNHETLLVAYSLYLANPDAPKWPLVLTGDLLSQEERLRRITSDLEITNNVIFAGYVSDRQIQQIIERAEVMLFPSLHEGFGIPILEAMTANVPVVASSTTSLPEIIEEAGLLVDTTDVQSFCEALLDISVNPGLRQKLRERGAVQAAKFNPDQEYRILLENLIDASKSPSRWRKTGFHDADGLTDPVALFAIPKCQGPVTMHLNTKPLGASRNILLCNGRTILTENEIPANQTATIVTKFIPRTPVITIRILNAENLDPDDPRTHGILIEELCMWDAQENFHDLLNSRTQ